MRRGATRSNVAATLRQPQSTERVLVSKWMISLGLAALFIVTRVAYSNTIAPWAPCTTEPVSLLLFVEPDCRGCLTIYADFQAETSMRVVSTSEVDGYNSLV